MVLDTETDESKIERRELYAKDPTFSKYLVLTSKEERALCKPTTDNNMPDMRDVFKHEDIVEHIVKTGSHYESVKKQTICCFTGRVCSSQIIFDTGRAYHTVTDCTQCKIPEHYPARAKLLLDKARGIQ